MALAPDTTLGTAPTAALPHRQSCDRCHKQKLRCTRENNGNGGVCDRCLRKRAQCVYSFSLPKGRPSLYRLTDESTTGTENQPVSPAIERAKPPPVLFDGTADSGTEASIPDAHADADANASNLNVDATAVIVNPSTNDHSGLAGLMATPPVDISTGTLPWPDTLAWDDVQLEADWSIHDSSYSNAVLASLDTFGGDGSAREGHDTPSPTGALCPPSPWYPYSHAHSQPGCSLLDGSTRSNTDRTLGGGGIGGGTINTSLEKYISYPSLDITQLSQLSMRLSSLHYSSYTLAKAAESSSRLLPNGGQIPLIDAAAFESVAAWLTHGDGSASVNTNLSIHIPPESQFHYPSPEMKPGGGHGILHDVFSASHQLLEILRRLQSNNMVEPFNSSTIASASMLSAAPSDQRNAYFGLTKRPGSSDTSSGSQQHRNHTMQIIRHLVMACEALLLEIYVAVLIVLQHDAHPDASMNTMALGDVRLVLAVQLCSYLIERQQQAVELFLATESPPSPLSVSGLFPHTLDLSHQSVPTRPILVTVERNVLNDLKNQVQQKIGHLRQTLRCT